MKNNTLSICKIALKLPLVACLWFGAVHAQGTFELLTLNPVTGALPDSFYNSNYPAVTPDGRYVVYESSQSALLPQASNGMNQTFLFDRRNNLLELISADGNGVQGNDSSYRPAISADGCKIVFYSYASNLVANDSNNVTDVFLRDRCQQPMKTSLISVSSSGVLGNRASTNPDISADGLWVVFDSDADNFVAEDTRGVHQIYQRDLLAGTTVRLSTPIQGVGDGGGGLHPAISNDGARVAFWSFSSDLISNDSNGVWDIFLYDRNATPKISIVSVDINGNQRQQGDESSSRIVEPAISADGRYISFATTASNLVANDNNQAQDVFVKDTYPASGHASGPIIRASVTSSGVEGNGDSPKGQGERAALSGDGTWVVFFTDAKNLTADGKGYRTVAHNNNTGETIEFAPYSGSSSNRPAISGINPSDASDNKGRFVVFFDGQALDSRFNSGGIFLHDREPDDISCLFNWAEKNYPALFSPSGFPTTISRDYAYRYYSATKAYLRVSMVDNHVYYTGADEVLLDVGPLSDWLPKAGCQPPPPNDCLFNWAENNYPGLFAPSGSPTEILGVYTYRYYWMTKAYLGISSADNRVYYMGADGILLDEGPLSYWLPKASCQ